jgi:hypothetical protein
MTVQIILLDTETLFKKYIFGQNITRAKRNQTLISGCWLKCVYLKILKKTDANFLQPDIYHKEYNLGE